LALAAAKRSATSRSAASLDAAGAATFSSILDSAAAMGFPFRRLKLETGWWSLLTCSEKIYMRRLGYHKSVKKILFYRIYLKKRISPSAKTAH